MQNMQNTFNQMYGAGGQQGMGMQNNWGGSSGGPLSFNNYMNQLNNSQMGRNHPIDSNAGLRDPNANYTPVNPYQMQQSQQSPYTWTGNGWTESGPQNQQASYAPSPGQRPSTATTANTGGYGRPDPFQRNIPQNADRALTPWQNSGMRPGTSPAGTGYGTPPSQISTSGQLPSWSNYQGQGGGPRPRPQTDPYQIQPRQNFAPGQQQYTGPAISSMNQYRPGMGIGPGGPARPVPGFNPGGPQNPYRPTTAPGYNQQMYSPIQGR